MKTGIYKITNLINGHTYIGQSTDIERRWENHKIAAYNKNDAGYMYPLYQAIRKYGIEQFSFEVLEECDYKLLNEKEMYYIQQYDTYYHGYNQTLGGDCATHSSKLTIEQVQEIQNKLLTQKYTLRALANEYGVHTDTIRDINNGTTWAYLNSNLKFPLYISVKNPLYQSQSCICPICGKTKDIKAQRCRQCTINEQRKGWPSKEELHDKIIELKGNFTQVGRIYQVTDNAVRKWCKAYGLPFHSKDYK